MSELVYIEWLDSAAMHGWQSLDRIRADAGPVLIQSVGWVVCETDTAVTLVAHKHRDTADSVPMATDPLTIPKGVITLRKRMRAR